jgi:transposase-like protein
VVERNKKSKSNVWSPKLRAKALAALAANGGNVSGTAKQLGITRYKLCKLLEEFQKAKQSDSSSQQHRDLAAELETIAWKLLAAIPEKIDKAPLHQLTSTFKFTRETLQSIKDEELDKNSRPIDLSKMTNEQLEQLERLTTLLLRNMSGSAIPELSSTESENEASGSSTLAIGLEPTVPISQVRDD